jgi:hypothetical protein
MFYGQCWKCGERWALGTASTCTCVEKPAREWVGLTDEEIENMMDYWSDDARSAYGGAHAANGEYVYIPDIIRYAEARLKEKNT